MDHAGLHGHFQSVARIKSILSIWGHSLKHMPHAVARLVVRANVTQIEHLHGVLRSHAIPTLELPITPFLYNCKYNTGYIPSQANQGSYINYILIVAAW